MIFRVIAGEENSCTPEMTASWEQTNLPTSLSRYELKDIYNADEFGLFYPTKTLHSKGLRCAGGKFSRVRLTGVAAANAMGGKLPMAVIGRSEKPRCFIGVKSLLCQYESQKKSWMDSEIFTNYIRKLDRKFQFEGRKVTFIIDNCPAHPSLDNLKAMELILLPPNTTSKMQPMDQGVIRALMTYYRSKIFKRYIPHIDSGKELVSISILAAMRMLVESWDAVSSDTAVNCFKKAGISKETRAASLADDDEPFKLLAGNVDELKARGVVGESFAEHDYVDFDFNVCKNETFNLKDEEIVAAISGAGEVG